MLDLASPILLKLIELFKVYLPLKLDYMMLVCNGLFSLMKDVSVPLNVLNPAEELNLLIDSFLPIYPLFCIPEVLGRTLGCVAFIKLPAPTVIEEGPFIRRFI